MLSICKTSQIGTNAVRRLREKKLKNGLPFMINDHTLAEGESYLEYPDGSIKLITIISAKKEIDVVRELSPEEAAQLRIRFHFSVI